VRRAKIGIWLIATASMRLNVDAPSSTSTRIAARISGKDIRMSTPRMMAQSIQPPMTPDMSPTAPPMATARATAPTETNIIGPSPCRMRLNWSRPKPSVPSRWPGENGASMGEPTLSMGS
jgi:hypothetical protein